MRHDASDTEIVHVPMIDQTPDDGERFPSAPKRKGPGSSPGPFQCVVCPLTTLYLPKMSQNAMPVGGPPAPAIALAFLLSAEVPGVKDELSPTELNDAAAC